MGTIIGKSPSARLDLFCRVMQFLRGNRMQCNATQWKPAAAPETAFSFSFARTRVLNTQHSGVCTLHSRSPLRSASRCARVFRCASSVVCYEYVVCCVSHVVCVSVSVCFIAARPLRALVLHCEMNSLRAHFLILLRPLCYNTATAPAPALAARAMCSI